MFVHLTDTSIYSMIFPHITKRSTGSQCPDKKMAQFTEIADQFYVFGK